MCTIVILLEADPTDQWPKTQSSGPQSIGYNQNFDNYGIKTKIVRTIGRRSWVEVSGLLERGYSKISSALLAHNGPYATVIFNGWLGLIWSW